MDAQDWAVIRLATVQKKGEAGRLLFATVTEMVRGAALPARMEGADCFSLKGRGHRLLFRRTILSKQDAIDWYRSLGDGECKTPIPTRVEDREALDGLPIYVPALEDLQPWPVLGLPLMGGGFFGSDVPSTDPAPFIGSVAGRLHRRLGDGTGLAVLLEDAQAQAFVARRMHVNLFDYQEYLGSAVYVAPDPVIQRIDNLRIPAQHGQGEGIFYRIVPRPGQSLEGLRLTAFDEEAGLLTSFKTYSIPADGILEVEKGLCMGQYGFVITHDQHGALAHHPLAGFLRSMHFQSHVSSGRRLTVSVPVNESPEAHRIEYPAAGGKVLASKSVIGEDRATGARERIHAEARKREKKLAATKYGQHWFPAGSREEAMRFVHGLLRSARRRVMIADPYWGALQLSQFLYAVHGDDVSVTLLTSRLAFESKPETSDVTKRSLIQKFQRDLGDLKQHQNLTLDVRVMAESSLHDRFLVVDDAVWFSGHSLNGLGSKGSMVVRLPDSESVIEKLEGLREQSPTLKKYARSNDAVDA